MEAPEGALAVALPDARRAGAALTALARVAPLGGALRHLKRLRRGPGGRLRALLCTRRPLTWGGWSAAEAEVGPGSAPDLPVALAVALEELGLAREALEEALVPGRAPVSAEEAAEQSAALWPIAFKPTVRVGPLLSALAQRCLQGPACDGVAGAGTNGTPGVEVWVAEVDEARHWLERVAKKGGVFYGRDAGNAALVVGPGGCLLAEGEDRTRGPGGNPLRHAVREALDAAARAGSSASDAGERGKKRRLHEVSREEPQGGAGPAGGGYLLTGCDFYVLREPCAMCAMALVHARVRRIFYCIQDPEHGMLGGHFPLHSLQGSHLNHYYEVFHWPLNE